MRKVDSWEKKEINKFTCGLTWNCCIVGYAIAWGIVPPFGVAAGVNWACVWGTQAAAPCNGIEAPILFLSYINERK